MKSYIEISSDINNKILVVDFLKGFSIITIVLMHLLDNISSLPPIIHTMSAVGGTGVHVFFLCSGIGLYTSYLKHKTSYVTFFKKRFFKIYIPYIIIILFAFFSPWLYYGDNKITALLSHVFLFKMFSPVYDSSFGEPFWFISTLFQLYALFIPMCWLKEKTNSKWFTAMFCSISISWWFFCYFLGIGNIRIWGSFCFQYIWEFAIGFVLAEKFYFHKKYNISNYLLFTLAIIGIGLQASMALYSNVLKLFNDIPALVGYLSLALLLSNISFVNNFCNKLSSFSYELYLIHNLVFVGSFYFFRPAQLATQLILGIIAFIIALASSFFYKKILEILRNKIKNKQL